MTAAEGRFYITTPIYYPNGEPHLGHIYTTLCADTLARYHRLQGTRVHFLTGTDEHGIKMVKTAADLNVEPGALAEKMSASFRSTFDALHVTYDDYIRTSEPRHKDRVQEVVRRLQAKGDIYLGAYQGWYDEGQEEFVTETEAKAHEFKSVISGRPLTRYSEPTYFFRLSKYVPEVIKYIEANPAFIRPESRRNEVLSKLRMGVEDLSISRASLKWGIAMPDDPEHVVYVWIDALSNYITAIGLPEIAGTPADPRADLWPVNVHLLGKEILWFHAVYWPAMLMALGMPLPQTLFAHGWWTSEGRKMSKTMGNFIDLAKIHELTTKYGQETLRFHLLRVAPFGTDMDFNQADFVRSYSELGNVLGNLLNRVINMIGKYREGKLPAIGVSEDVADGPVVKAIAELPAKLGAAYAALELQSAATLALDVCRVANTYVDATRPFSLAKDPAQAARLDTILHLTAQAVRASLAAMLPILPEKAAQGLRQLGVSVEGRTLTELIATPIPVGQLLGPAEVLFPRVDEPAK